MVLSDGAIPPGDELSSAACSVRPAVGASGPRALFSRVIGQTGVFQLTSVGPLAAMRARGEDHQVVRDPDGSSRETAACRVSWRTSSTHAADWPRLTGAAASSVCIHAAPRSWQRKREEQRAIRRTHLSFIYTHVRARARRGPVRAVIYSWESKRVSMGAVYQIRIVISRKRGESHVSPSAVRLAENAGIAASFEDTPLATDVDRPLFQRIIVPVVLPIPRSRDRKATSSLSRPLRSGDLDD